ncbi:MAG: hypothetical protein R3F59_06905 [Myxococcota bacterium]
MEAHRALRDEWADVLADDEADAIATLQEGLLNFYAADTVNPYA